MSPDMESARFAGIDKILREHSSAVRAVTEQVTELQVEQRAFLDGFAAKCENELVPTMQAVVVRLAQNGGGGLVDYVPLGGRASGRPTLTLWMSLDGEVTGIPNYDRLPFLELVAHARPMKVEVSEGDIWEKGDAWVSVGSHSRGIVGAWDLEHVTSEAVIDEVSAILARAVSGLATPPAFKG
jgi:hypothetical protein